MLQSLPEPDFSNISDEDLFFEVLREMHLTNFLESYYKRIERSGSIITKWNQRTIQLKED